MRNINSQNKVPVASESTAESNEGAQTSGKRKSTKYETFPHAEERYLVNWWKEYHDQLESKNARKVWNKIVDDLNTRFKSNRTVYKCRRKIKYLIDKYKEKKTGIVTKVVEILGSLLFTMRLTRFSDVVILLHLVM